MKMICLALAAMVVIVVVSKSTSAQQPFSTVQQQSTTSPYLNLLSRQGSGQPNYQTLVRPQLETNQQFAKQQNQIQRLQRQQANQAAGGGGGAQRGVSSRIRTTGQYTHNRFMDTSHFFPQR